jgi:hypothetical protein
LGIYLLPYEQMKILMPICSASSSVDNMNVQHSTAREISGLEDGACGGIPNECRPIAARMLTVDRK